MLSHALLKGRASSGTRALRSLDDCAGAGRVTTEFGAGGREQADERQHPIAQVWTPATRVRFVAVIAINELLCRFAIVLSTRIAAPVARGEGDKASSAWTCVCG